MKKINKIVYTIRMIFFCLQFIFIYMCIDAIYHTRLFGYIFLALYIIYVISVIGELLSKKISYQEDLVYNFMQIGTILYIFALFFQIRIAHVSVMSDTLSYFNLNFKILSFLLIVIVLYNIIELKNKK